MTNTEGRCKHGRTARTTERTGARGRGENTGRRGLAHLRRRGRGAADGPVPLDLTPAPAAPLPARAARPDRPGTGNSRPDRCAARRSVDCRRRAALGCVRDRRAGKRPAAQPVPEPPPPTGRRGGRGAWSLRRPALREYRRRDPLGLPRSSGRRAASKRTTRHSLRLAANEEQARSGVGLEGGAR